MHHYTESGLENVFLSNGYELIDTPHGRAVAVHNVEGLHREIGRWLVELPKRLTGAELRFLRTELDVSQKRLGELLGSNEQAVKRWEKARSRPIPGTADRLVRVLYVEFALGRSGTLRSMIERLAGLDEIEVPQKAALEATNDNWALSRLAA